MTQAALKDTIIVFVRDTIPQSDMIEAYQELIQAQQSTYSFLLYAFLGIVTIFTGSIVYFNIVRIKNQIRELTQEIFTEEKKDLISKISEYSEIRYKKIEKNYRNKFLEIEAESARLFGLTASDKEGISWAAITISWLLGAISKYAELDSYDLIRKLLNIIVLKIEWVKLEKDGVRKFAKCYDQNIKLSDDFKKIKSIPDYYSAERNQILEFFNTLKAEIAKSKKPKPKKSD